MSDFQMTTVNALKNNGGYPEPNIYDINDDEGGAVFDCLLSFTSKDANIEVVYELTSLPEGIIPFARDPFGDLFVLITVILKILRQ